MKKIYVSGFIAFLGLSAFAIVNYNCINLPLALQNYFAIVFPKDVQGQLPDVDNMASNDSAANAGATLGRVLFYGAGLSKNRTISAPRA